MYTLIVQAMRSKLNFGKIHANIDQQIIKKKFLSDFPTRPLYDGIIATKERIFPAVREGEKT